MGVQKQKIDRQKKESHDQKEGTIDRTGMGDDHDRDHDQRNSKGKEGHEIHNVYSNRRIISAVSMTLASASGRRIFHPRLMSWS